MAVKPVHHIKYKNIAIALAILLLIILAISSACSDKSSKTKDLSSSASNNTSAVDEKNKLTDNFRYVSLKNEEALGKGVLTLIDKTNKYTGGAPADLDGIYGYMFNKSDEQVMSTSSTDVKGSKELLEALNAMMSDFYSKTKFSNTVVTTIYYSANGTEKTDDTATALDSKEHETGYAFDFKIYDAETGAYPEFTGEGKYKWILDNCYKYGIVQRYTEAKANITGVKAMTNHFRYVGKPNAEIMAEKDLCLEEYIDFIKNYSFEKPFIYESDDYLTYAVYYIAADKGKTTNIPIPLKENDTEYPYAYSGNNKDGFIMWVITEDNTKLKNADSSTAEKADTSKADDKKAADSKPADSKAETTKTTTTKKAATTKKATAAADNTKDKSSTAETKKSDDTKTDSTKSL